MQSSRTIGDSDGVAQKKSAGKWKCTICSSVLLELVRSQSTKDDQLVIVPQPTEIPEFKKKFVGGKLGGIFGGITQAVGGILGGIHAVGVAAEFSEAPQPVMSQIQVDNDRLSVYGVIRATKKGDEVCITVEPPDLTHEDLSYKFSYYIWHPDDESSGPAKPPSYILFESLLYRNFFICWDLTNQTAQCEQLPIPPDTLVDDIDSHLNNDQIQKFVWVIPIDDSEDEQFALKTYGKSQFLAFAKTGGAILVPGKNVNPEVIMFSFRMSN